MKSSTLLAATFTVGASVVSGIRTLKGCYEVFDGVKFFETFKFNSVGICGDSCPKNAVFALSSTDCYCGDKFPNDFNKVGDDKCTMTCDGWKPDLCGGVDSGIQYYSFYDSGLATNIPQAAQNNTIKDGASSTTSATTTKPTAAPPPAQTVVIVQTSAAKSNAEGSPSKAGIVAGAVIGVLAVIGLCAGGFFFIRHRKRRAIEAEHRRNAEINKAKSPVSSTATSFTDTRLDPTFAQRRMSDGSIADNQDYSRRILKVTNA